MPVPRIVLDGTQAYGSVIITVNANPFTINNFRVTRPATEAKDFKYQGDPNRLRKTVDVITFTGDLQLAASNTTYPQFGDTFTGTFDSNYGAETFCFDPPAFEMSNQAGQIRTVPVTGWRVLNSITVVT